MLELQMVVRSLTLFRHLFLFFNSSWTINNPVPSTVSISYDTTQLYKQEKQRNHTLPFQILTF